MELINKNGIKISIKNNHLVISPKAKITDALLKKIKKYKKEIVNYINKKINLSNQKYQYQIKKIKN